MESILQELNECYICRRFLGVKTTQGLETHHFIYGRGLRALADDDGLHAKLCYRHHRALHDDPSHPYDRELKEIAQAAYLLNHTREEFLSRYGRFFD